MRSIQPDGEIAMKKNLTKITCWVLLLVGPALWAGSMWLLVRFVAYGDNHPINVVLGIFGVAPVMVNVADMSWINNLLEMIASLFTAAMIYTGLGSLSIAVAQELSFLIAAGGLKKYRELERAPTEPVSGITGMLFNFLRGPK